MAKKNYYNAITPAGRWIGGSITRPRTTTSTGKLLTNKDNSPRKEYSVGLAIPKTDINIADHLQDLCTFVKREFPHRWPGGVADINDASFSWKITDGDSTRVDKKGKRACDKPNYAGNWVFWFTSDHPPYCVTDKGATLIPDISSLELGYWFNIGYSACANTGTGSEKEGIYVNLEGMNLVKKDEVISGRPPASVVFANATGTAEPNRDILSGPAPAAPAAPTPPPATPVQFSYNGALWTKDVLLKAGWAEADIEALPRG